ncbi:MAG: DUF3309 family protein [Anaerolineaceae bacterium]|jgi:hypothetical protein|nr:DUF3309 family protein [Anaerolineaceae bacterium]
MLSTILLVILILAVLGSLPVWPYSRDWGYRGSGVLGTLLLILILALVFGWI